MDKKITIERTFLLLLSYDYFYVLDLEHEFTEIVT